MSTENTNTAVAEEIPNLLITPSAQEYLHDLLTKQNTPELAFEFLLSILVRHVPNAVWHIVRQKK